MVKRETSVVDQIVDSEEEATFENLAGEQIAAVKPVAAEVEEEVLGFSSNVPVYQFENPQFEAQDMAMPKIRLMQMQSPAVVERKAMPGQWLADGHDPVDELDFIPQAVAKTRELRDEDGKMLARSPDGVNCCLGGGRKCANCPNAQWDRSDPNAVKPPKCQEVWRYIVVSATHDALAEMSFTKTAVPAAGFINLQMKMKVPGRFALQATSTQEKGKGPRGGYYYVPKLTILQMEPEDLARYRRMAVPDTEALPAPTAPVEIPEVTETT
jgi:hypothetical protein